MSEVIDAYGRSWVPTEDTIGNIVWDAGVGFTLSPPGGAATIADAANGMAPHDWPQPVPELPATVATWQLKIAMSKTQSKTGTPRRSVFDDAEAAVAARGGALAIAWAGGADISLTGSTLAALAPAIQLTGADVIALFTLAAGIAA